MLEVEDALQLSRDALREHGSFKADFENACSAVADELNLIDKALS